MIILGIDPGTATTGYGVIEKSQKSTLASDWLSRSRDQTKFKIRNSFLRCLAYGCITTPKDKNPGERLWMLEKALKKIIHAHKPDMVAMEALYFFKNFKTAIPVSQAQGVLLLTCAKKKLKIHEISPLQAKMAITGYGRAEKNQVQQMVKEILHLPVIPKPDDASDALALAIAYSFL